MRLCSKGARARNITRCTGYFNIVDRVAKAPQGNGCIPYCCSSANCPFNQRKKNPLNMNRSVTCNPSDPDSDNVHPIIWDRPRAIASEFGRHNSPRRAPTRGALLPIVFSRRFALRRAPTRGAPTRFRQPHEVFSNLMQLPCKAPQYGFNPIWGQVTGYLWRVTLGPAARYSGQPQVWDTPLKNRVRSKKRVGMRCASGQLHRLRAGRPRCQGDVPKWGRVSGFLLSAVPAAGDTPAIPGMTTPNGNEFERRG